MPPTRKQGVAREHGIGLIEILIAVLLMSIGFLASARMQVAGMRYSQSAYHQSQAYLLASDMIDRMRSNVQGVSDGFYSDRNTSTAAKNPECNVSPCNPRGIAQQDIYDWSTSLYPIAGTEGFVPVLPSSSSTTAMGEIDDLGNGVFAVVMTWSEIVNGADTPQTLRIQFALETGE